MKNYTPYTITIGKIKFLPYEEKKLSVEDQQMIRRKLIGSFFEKSIK